MRHLMLAAAVVTATAMGVSAGYCAGGARTPFSDGGPTYPPDVSKRRYDCQMRYDAQMRVSAQHYGRLLDEQKNIIQRLNADIVVIRRQKVISAAMAAVIRLRKVR